MKILSDHHHDDLFESLRILFEDRFQYDFYRPIGLEWYTEGYWDVYNHIDTATQYLGLQIGEEFEKLEAEEGMNWMNRGSMEDHSGTYVIPRFGHNKTHRAITLEAFKATKFDIIISSIPSHFKRFEKLISLYQPQAKHIFQMGNNWAPPAGVKNVLNSTTVAIPSSINSVRYHQEFDTSIFKPTTISDPRSVINMQHYMHDPATFRALRAKLPSWNFKEYGAGNADGAVESTALASTIKESGFVYHVKRGGEGFGYNIHHAYACGKPMIVKSSLFKGMTAYPLFVDGETCVDIENKSIDQISENLEFMANDYARFSSNAFNKFKEIVDYEKEFERIKEFVRNLL